jgi:hypothetical protein
MTPKHRRSIVQLGPEHIGEYLFRNKELDSFLFTIAEQARAGVVPDITLDELVHINDLYLEEVAIQESKLEFVARKFIKGLISSKQSIVPRIYTSGYCQGHEKYTNAPYQILSDKEYARFKDRNQNFFARHLVNCPSCPNEKLEVSADIIYFLPMPKVIPKDSANVLENEYGISQISVRIKNISIKLVTKTLGIIKDESTGRTPQEYQGFIMDGLGVRIILDKGQTKVTEQTCRDAKEEAENIFTNVLGGEVLYSKDYIKKPGPAGYRGLHFYGMLHGYSVEVQVKSKDMHQKNERSPELKHDGNFQASKITGFFRKMNDQQRALVSPLTNIYFRAFDSRGRPNLARYPILEAHFDKIERILREEHIRYSPLSRTWP